jgi:hypothetical protein
MKARQIERQRSNLIIFFGWKLVTPWRLRLRAFMMDTFLEDGRIDWSSFFLEEHQY